MSLFGKRLALEQLEDRTTPAILLNLAPTPFVAVNPQPLPPQVVPLFTPEPALISPGPTNPPASGAPTAAAPFHIQGEVTESIQGGWTLDAVYTLDGQFSQTQTGAGSASISYSYQAHVTETLIPPVPSNIPVWTADATENSHGDVSVFATKVEWSTDLIAASFHDDTTVHEAMRKAGGDAQSWTVDATAASQGAMIGSATGGVGGETLRWNAIQIDSLVAETLTPVDPSGNPGPAWQISETVVTKDPDHRDRFTASDGGQVVQDNGTAPEITDVSATVTPPANPGEPPPTSDVFTDVFHAHEDYHSIVI